VETKAKARSHHSDEDDRIAPENHRGDREQSGLIGRRSPADNSSNARRHVASSVDAERRRLENLQRKRSTERQWRSEQSRTARTTSREKKHQETSDDIDTPRRGNVVVQPTAVPSHSIVLKN
jgi:hypothetical protein